MALGRFRIPAGELPPPEGMIPHGSGTIVHKYGGSSLATCKLIRGVAERLEEVHRSGRPAVVVVSARGDTTDILLAMAAEISSSPAGRELDQLLATGECASAALLALALLERGIPAVSLTGAQTGIRATGRHGAGLIVSIDTERITRLSAEGNLVVLAGFQGINAEGDIVTLGRGGSDTTAVALASELRSGHCEIYTDVDGVYTADPRVVAAPSVLPSVDVDVMAEMSFAGAKVMHSRAVELAAVCGVAIHVGRSATGEIGTVISRLGRKNMLETRSTVAAVVHDTEVAQVDFRCAGDEPAVLEEVFGLLGRSAAPVDMVTVSTNTAGTLTVGMTVHAGDVPAIRGALLSLAATTRDGRIEVHDRIGKVSVVGTGLLNRPEYAAAMLAGLSSAGITARSITASQSRICAAVPIGDLIPAVRLLHERFGLEPDRTRSPQDSTVPA
ncbi:aspartate kinase [Amycolatopsis nigrescens]|uniref:aspartate kinase n=1 Tax=Amycolatopsis nigrescens TaxID=381445 RepID=UPI001FE1E992|nr:aspartate kinase [Amycolatopsis nigrescens]